jgi:hypothetical protein
MTQTVHTEAEAAKQECPQKLVHPGIPGTARLCVGSRCMAWRWFSRSTLPGEAKGYCGLAGTPAPRSSRNA